MRFVSLLSSVYLFVFAGDMVWLFTSNQANEPIAVIWWAEVIASAGFAVFGLIGAILSARKLWREGVYETIDVKGTAMTEQVPPAGGKDSAMSNSLTGNKSMEDQSNIDTGSVFGGQVTRERGKPVCQSR